MISTRRYSKYCMGWSTQHACLPVISSQSSVPQSEAHQSLKERYPFCAPLVQRLPTRAAPQASSASPCSSLSIKLGSGHILLASHGVENGLWSLGSNAYHALGQRPFASAVDTDTDGPPSMLRQLWQAFLLEPFQDEFKADWQHVTLDPSMTRPFTVNQIASGLYHSLALVTQQGAQTAGARDPPTGQHASRLVVIVGHHTTASPTPTSPFHSNGSSIQQEGDLQAPSLYSWGSGFLGFGDEIYDATPRRMDCFPKTASIDHVDCAGYYSLVRMKTTGELWFWGTMGSPVLHPMPAEKRAWSWRSLTSLSSPSPLQQQQHDQARQGRVKYISPVQLQLPLPCSPTTRTLVHPHFILLVADIRPRKALQWTLVTHLNETDLALALQHPSQQEAQDYPATFESFVCRTHFVADDWRSLSWTLNEQPGLLCDAKLQGSMIALLFQCTPEHESISPSQLVLYRVQSQAPHVAFHSKVQIQHELVDWTLSGSYLYLVERAAANVKPTLVIYQIHAESMTTMVYRNSIDHFPIQFHTSPQHDFLLMLTRTKEPFPDAASSRTHA